MAAVCLTRFLMVYFRKSKTNKMDIVRATM